MRNRGSAVIIENNKVALIKRVRDGQEYYVFPGGGIENEENPEQAAVRETFEELGVHISIKDSLGIVNYTGVQYFFVAEVIGGDIRNGEGEEYSGEVRNRGTYEPMWIELESLLTLDVHPIEIAEKVYSIYRPCNCLKRGEGMKGSRLQAIEAAKRFIAEKFPDCQAALLAGSVIRGEETATSDLDIVVFDEKIESAYRESLIEYGWPIEVFVHNFTSYKMFFKEDCERARPSLPRMVSEGVILFDSGVLSLIKEEANELLKKGPEVWSIETIEMKRYMMTDALDDLIGSTNRAEEIFIANTLADAIHEFFLRTNVQWIGASKWIMRALNQFDKNFARTFVHAFDAFYKTGNKDAIIDLADEVLKPYGGRLFEGYSLGKGDRI